MKKPFSRESSDKRAEYLRQHRSKSNQEPAPLPAVMPPLRVTALDESRRINQPGSIYNKPSGTSRSTRTPMMNLVYPPLKESELRDAQKEAIKRRRQTPLSTVNKLAGKVIAMRKAISSEKPVEDQDSEGMPNSVYINRHVVISQPKKRKFSLKGINLGWRLLSLGLAGVFSYCLYFMWTSPLFKLAAPVVSGNVRVSSAEFIKAMAVEGKPSFAVVPSEVHDALLNAFPELVTADLHFNFPNQVNLVVSEREPVLIWKQGGQTLWIDLFGIPMMPRGEPGNWYVVTAAGDAVGLVPIDPVNHPGQYKPVAGTDLILMILNLANMTPSGTAIAYDPRYGLGWNDPQGWKVYFGFNMEGLDSKVAQYAGIVTNLNNQGIQPKIISVQYPYAPFYRLEQ